MNLGDLEFKAEDFADISYGSQNFAERANQLLRERFEHSPDVYRATTGFIAIVTFAPEGRNEVQH